MNDKFGYNINLDRTQNPHLLVWGKTGSGKTYFCCRHLEELYEQQKKTLVIDYSGSYTSEELVKSDFQYMSNLMIYNPYIKPLYWYITAPDFESFLENLSSILIRALDINSYNQKKLIREALHFHFYELDRHNFNFSDFFSTLEILLEQKENNLSSADEITNMKRLLTRFDFLSSVKNIYFGFAQNATPSNPVMTLLQLSDFSDLLRDFLTLLFSELIWLETRQRKGEHYYACILFDEFQHLKIKPDSPLSHFLREGRKFGTAVILSSQFISTYSAEELHTLFQVGNILIFKPTDNDLKFSASIIDPNSPLMWRTILESLDTGEAVLKGHWKLEGHSHSHSEPIICCIPKVENGGEISGN